MQTVDLSCFPVNKGTNSRLGWAKYSDLCEIIHPSLYLIFLCLLTGAKCEKGLFHKEFISSKTRRYDLDLDFRSRGGENL